jgi:hypothetical protein
MRLKQKASYFGDGASMDIGTWEIFRRLAGVSRVAELSIDDPKARYVSASQLPKSQRQLWQVMGHPKLLSRRSIDVFKNFFEQMNFQRCETVSTVADLIRSGEWSSANRLC